MIIIMIIVVIVVVMIVTILIILIIVKGPSMSYSHPAQRMCEPLLRRSCGAFNAYKLNNTTKINQANKVYNKHSNNYRFMFIIQTTHEHKSKLRTTYVFTVSFYNLKSHNFKLSV